MDLKQKTAKGILWLSLSSSLSKALQFITKIILARLLLPEEFGLMAIALLLLNSLGLLQNMGLGHALIQRKSDVDKAANNIFIAVPILGLVLCIISFFSARYIAQFFNNPVVESIIKVLSFTFIISSFNTVPSSLLSREIEFKKKFIPDVGSIVSYAIVAITLARMGWGVWSLVYGYLCSVTVNLLLLWRVCLWRPSFRFDWQNMKELFNYGRYVVGIGILAFLLLQGDDVVVGKMLGVSALGFYALAYTISNLPSTNITHVISGGIFPAFSKLQDDRKRLGSSFLKSMRLISILILPVAAGIFILAPDFISLILGKKWMPMLSTLRVLCLFGIFRSLHNISGYIFIGIGKPKIEQNILALELIGLAAVIFPLTLKFGILGTAFAVTGVMLFGGGASIWLVLRILGIKASRLIKTIFVPLVGSLAMVLIICLFKKYITSEVPVLSHFLCFVGIGIFTYLMAVFLLDTQIIKEVREFLLLVSRGEKVNTPK